jgi:hypothetical protein
MGCGSSQTNTAIANPEIDTMAWITSAFGPGFDIQQDNSSVSLGLVSDVKRYKVTKKSDGTFKIYLLKSFAVEKLDLYKALGLNRESWYYQNFSHKIVALGIQRVPVPLAYANPNNGQKYLFMEDVSNDCIHGGYFFGTGPEACWNLDREKIKARYSDLDKYGPVTAETFTHEAFKIAAKIHAKFWMDPSLLKNPWLQRGPWYQGQDEQSWRMMLDMSDNLWRVAKEKIKSGGSGVRFNDKWIEIMDASRAKESWTAYVEWTKQHPFTYLHGDFQPSNIMWDYKNRKCVPIDWELTNLGSGIQDISFYMIIYVDPPLRRRIEERLVRTYYQELLSFGDVKVLNEHTYTWEQCWAEYKVAGLERHIWLMGGVTAIYPDPPVQFFHDQMVAFMEDHNITPANIGMPRV